MRLKQDKQHFNGENRRIGYELQDDEQKTTGTKEDMKTTKKLLKNEHGRAEDAGLNKLIRYGSV